MNITLAGPNELAWVDLIGLSDDQHAVLARIATLFATHGHEPYEGQRREAVSALEHSLQCAQLAEWAHASPALVAAALLHDIGHFEIDVDEDTDDSHEERAAAWLEPVFGPAVSEPVRLHVQAKRFLVSTEPSYADTLSSASVHSLALQGGPMSVADVAAFAAGRHADNAVRLRRWDEAAKEPGRDTPPLAHYLGVLATVLRG